MDQNELRRVLFAALTRQPSASLSPVQPRQYTSARGTLKRCARFSLSPLGRDQFACCLRIYSIRSRSVFRASAPA